jgi:hypothetical protein
MGPKRVWRYPGKGSAPVLMVISAPFSTECKYTTYAEAV